MDFVQHDSWGNRTHGLSLDTQPEDTTRYLVFDEPVMAPCSGEVVAQADTRPDHPAGNEYRDTSGSNYVTLRCGNTDVVMAHLKRHSIGVGVGDRVRAGDVIGLIGHSGNSEEPHLHINAQTLPDELSSESFLQPVVMTFEGRYLAAGDCL